MQQFTDGQNRTWTLRADVNAFDRIKQATNIDLTQVLTNYETIGQFSESLRTFGELVWAWLQPDLDREKVTPEDFGGALYDCFDEAFEAVLAEIPFFFLKQRRDLAQNMIAKFLEAERLGTDRANQILEGDQMKQVMNQALDQAEKQALEAAQRSIGGKKSTGSAESSESTPDH